MNSVLTVQLDATDEQRARLKLLQAAFAQACNALAPVVRQQRCWNRVALHHLMYRQLRVLYPELGSQMVCNAIYSVCRAARLVYQHPKSPHFIGRSGATVQTLPQLVFASTSPVYFDRHTLSVKDDRLSMYTMDGRVHFNLSLSSTQLEMFRTLRLREVILRSGVQATSYSLSFEFISGEVSTDAGEAPAEGALDLSSAPQWPDHLQVEAAT